MRRSSLRRGRSWHKCDATSPLEREHTVTRSKLRAHDRDSKALLRDDAALMGEILPAVVSEILEVEMTEPSAVLYAGA